MDYIQENGRVWDMRSENGDTWSQPVSADVTERARRGDWSIVLTPTKPVPRDWFPAELAGKKILCLAGGGGQQGPVLAAAGADVTVFDNSIKQLEKDEFVAARDGLQIRTVQGNMQDLSAFTDGEFDCIVHPWSNGYVSDVLPVWRECARVLKKDGVLLAGFGNPVEYLFDAEKLEKGEFAVRHRIPYADIEHQDDEAIMQIARSDGFIWSHTLTDQLQGQIAAGFAITGFYEDIGGTALDAYINTSIATRAVRL